MDISDEPQGRAHSIDVPCVSHSEDNHAPTLHKLRFFEVVSRMKLWHFVAKIRDPIATPVFIGNSWQNTTFRH